MKKFYLFKVLFIVWNLDKMCFDVEMYCEGYEKQYLFYYIFNLIISIGNCELKEDVFSFFVLGMLVYV